LLAFRLDGRGASRCRVHATGFLPGHCFYEKFPSVYFFGWSFFLYGSLWRKESPEGMFFFLWFHFSPFHVISRPTVRLLFYPHPSTGRSTLSTNSTCLVSPLQHHRGLPSLLTETPLSPFLIPDPGDPGPWEFSQSTAVLCRLRSPSLVDLLGVFDPCLDTNRNGPFRMAVSID